MVELYNGRRGFLPAVKETVVLEAAAAEQRLVGVKSLHAWEGRDGGVIEVRNGLRRPLPAGDPVVALPQPLGALSGVH